MNPLYHLLNENAVNALGWTLIHSLWQILLVGLLLKISLIFLKNKSAEIRFYVAVISFFSIIIASGVTFTKIYNSNIASTEQNSSIPDVAVMQGQVQTEAIVMAGSDLRGNWFSNNLSFLSTKVNSNLKFIIFFWFAGILIFSLRFAGNYWYIRRFKKKYTTSAGNELKSLVSKLTVQLKIRQKVRVLESILVKIPMVIGHFKPVIIVPVGLISTLPVDQVEAILIHELAHILRRDYLINLIKTLFEVIFFYHPVIWWISTVINAERENCCDDLAIMAFGREEPLRNALFNLHSLESKTISLATAFTNKKYKLLNRIMRMKTNPQFKHGIRESIAGFTVVLGGLIIFFAASAFSPRLADMPKMYKTQDLGVFAKTSQEIPNNQENSATADQSNLQENQTDGLFSGAIPDTTLGSSNSTASGNGKVTMEFDDNYNLISVKKGGKQLEGKEKEKYEAMAAKLKKMNDQEKADKARQAAMEKAQKEMDEAREQIDKAREAYEKAMEAYHNSMGDSIDRLIDQDFVWAGTNWNDSTNKYAFKLRNNFKNHYKPYAYSYSYSYPDNECLESLDKQLEDLDQNYVIYSDQALKLAKLDKDLQFIDIDKDLENNDNSKFIVVTKSGSGDLSAKLHKELMKDGILKSKNEKMHFQMNQDELEVNGKALSKDLYKKYLKIYRQETGSKLNGNFTIEIND